MKKILVADFVTETIQLQIYEYFIIIFSKPDS